MGGAVRPPPIFFSGTLVTSVWKPVHTVKTDEPPAYHRRLIGLQEVLLQDLASGVSIVYFLREGLSIGKNT